MSRTLAGLRQSFKGDFSASAFRLIDGEPNIVGKFGRICGFPGGLYEAWFIGPDLQPLSGRRMTILRDKCSLEGTFREVDGEGWVQGRGRDFVLRMAALAGVRRKRRASPAQLAGLARYRRANTKDRKVT
jgi:hypothetical protein